MDRSPKTRFLSVRILSAHGLCVVLLFLKSHLLHPGKRTTKRVRLSSIVTTWFINLLWGTSIKRCADGWNYPELLTAWSEERLGEARPPSGWQEAQGRLQKSLHWARLGGRSRQRARQTCAVGWDCRRGQAAGQSQWRYLVGSYKHTPNLGEGAALHRVGSCWHVVDTNWGSGVTEEGGGPLGIVS